MGDPRRAGVVAAGAAVVAGMIAAIVLWVVADRRLDDAIAGFARAPVGCETTLTFQTAGEYVVHVETSGSLGPLSGGCDASAAYRRDDPTPPAVDLELLGPDGEPVSLADATGPDYDANGFVGTAVGVATIGEPGEYVLAVRSPEDGFAVAVGRDPDDDVAPLRVAAVSSLIAGLLVGGVVFVRSSRRRDDRPTTWATPVPAETPGPKTGVVMSPPAVPGEPLPTAPRAFPSPTAPTSPAPAPSTSSVPEPSTSSPPEPSTPTDAERWAPPRPRIDDGWSAVGGRARPPAEADDRRNGQ